MRGGDPLDRPRGAWRSGDGSPEECRSEVEELIGMGENLIACDVCTDGLRMWPEDVRLRQLKALALARSGAHLSGLELVRGLESEGFRDQETIGMLGSIYKDLWTLEKDGGRRDELLDLARTCYLRASVLPDADSWSGINAATLALVAGEPNQARRLATRVRGECLAGLEKGDTPDPYWLQATMGEASLVAGDCEEAARWYARACATAGHRLGDIASTKRNAALILSHLDVEEARAGLVRRSFPVPRIAIFAGHMIDGPSRRMPRFPAEREKPVRDRIRERISAYGSPVIGFSSAACGADILFLEEVAKSGGETHIVLPFDMEQFIEESVACVAGGNWTARFHDVLGRAKSLTIASPCKTDDLGLAYDYSNMVLLGLALMKKRELEGEIAALTVWDGRPGDGFGGTFSNIDRWNGLGLSVEIVHPLEDLPVVSQGQSAERGPAGATDPVPSSSGGFSRPEVRALMFADLAGYTRLSESGIIDYVRCFMGSVRDLVESSGNAPVFSNTWGDGIFMVFDGVREAGLFALDLCDMIRGTDWLEKGLERRPSLRIALHAGPVQLCADPITDRPGYFGSHVGRAARMEPITEPGHVYTSGQFAALAECEGIEEFRCDYVGRIPLSKGYGIYPTYHLRRSIRAGR